MATLIGFLLRHFWFHSSFSNLAISGGNLGLRCWMLFILITVLPNNIDHCDQETCGLPQLSSLIIGNGDLD